MMAQAAAAATLRQLKISQALHVPKKGLGPACRMDHPFSAVPQASGVSLCRWQPGRSVWAAHQIK